MLKFGFKAKQTEVWVFVWFRRIEFSFNFNKCIYYHFNSTFFTTILLKLRFVGDILFRVTRQPLLHYSYLNSKMQLNMCFSPLENAIWPFATYNRVWLVFRKNMLVSKHCKWSSRVSLKADIMVNSVIMLSTKPPKMWTGVLEELRRNPQRNSVISCWPFIIIKTFLKGTSYMVIRHTVIQYHNCFGTTNLLDDYEI